MSSVPKTKLSRYGGWLPSRIIHESFINYHADSAAERLAKYRASHPQIPEGAPVPSSAVGLYNVPSVQAFAGAINGDPVMKDLFDKIFLQVSSLNQVPTSLHC
ncbi:hypothetical protein BDN67DRAFT_967173 [Paxillus ammoniavirescens]|nr:hypothetical protein BDN67DRAFT_967173 [Paxillus ammoniavirescens]